MKRWVMPATCTSWSPKLETSGVGLKPYFSAGITSATSRISVAARWKVAASSLARLGAGVWAGSNEGTAAATTAKNTTHARGDARAAEAHGFEDAEAEALGVGGVEADVGDLKIVLDGVDLLADDHAVGQAEAPHVAGERRERLAGEYEELEGLARARARGGLQQEVDALAVAQVGRVHHDDFVAEAELAADGFGRAAGWARSEKVVDDLDRAAEVEHALGLALERVGHGCDRVRRGQRVLDGGPVTGVVAEERRVRAVQGRDHTRLLGGREHRPR